MKLGTKSKRTVVLLALMSVLVLLGKAQSNLVLYHNSDQFNASNFNPAFLTSQQQFTFSIFPFAGMSVGYNNQAVIKVMLKNIIINDPTKDVFREVFNSLIKRGLFYHRFEMPLLSFGYNSEFGSFNFRVKDVEQMMSNFKNDFSSFITDSTFHTLATNNPQSFPAYGLYYREYSLGYAKEIIKNKLTIGIRAKLYFGKASAWSEVQGELVKENNTFYLETNGSVHLSVPVKIVQDDVFSMPIGGALADNFTPVNFLMNSKNTGTGFDFGISYQINRQVVLSASIVDLGKINWKNNLNTINYKGKYKFLSNYIIEAGNGYLTKNPNFSTDSTVQFFDLFKASVDSERFTTTLPTTFYFGLQYQISPKLNIGFVDRYIKVKGLNHNSFSLTADYDLSKKFSVSSGYSIIGNSFSNIPLAILYKWDAGQSYIGSDNVLSFLFKNSDFTGLTFGTCFYLFRKKDKYKELEYLPFYKDRKSKSATSKKD